MTRIEVRNPQCNCTACGRGPFIRKVGPAYLYQFRIDRKGYCPPGPIVCSVACHTKVQS